MQQDGEPSATPEEADLSWLHRVDRRHLERLCEEKKLSAEGDSEMLAERLRDNRGLSVAQLKSLCEVVGVTKQGNKADIAQRIGDKLAASAQQPRRRWRLQRRHPQRLRRHQQKLRLRLL